MIERPADSLPALIKPNARDELIQAMNRTEEKITKADLANKAAAKRRKFRNAFIQLSEEHCHFSKKQLQSFSQQHLVELDKIVVAKALQNIAKGIGSVLAVLGPFILGIVITVIFNNPVFFLGGMLASMATFWFGNKFSWPLPNSLDFIYLKLRKQQLPRLLENLSKKTKKLTAG